MADDASWFEDELEPARRPRRRIALAVGFAAVAWIVVAFVLLRSGSGAPPDGRAGATAGDVTGTDGLVADGPRTDAGEGARTADASGGPEAGEAGPTTTEGPSGASPAPPTAPGAAGRVGRDQAEALVIAVVRGWLSDAGPDLDVPGVPVDRRAYLEHVAVEGIDLPSDDLAVARTLLVLLVRDGDRYTDAVVRRAAVPLTVTATTVHPGGAPWWLPSVPDLTPVPPSTTPLDGEDERLAAIGALEDAGYEEVEVTDLAVTAAGAVVATVAARTPAGDPVDGPVWLHATPDGLVVLGGPHPATARGAPDGPGPGPTATPPGNGDDGRAADDDADAAPTDAAPDH